MNKLVENESSGVKSELLEQNTAVARLQREKMQRDVAVEKLAAVDGILARRRQALAILNAQIHESKTKGIDIDDLLQEREAAQRRVQVAQAKSDELQDQIMGS